MSYMHCNVGRVALHGRILAGVLMTLAMIPTNALADGKVFPKFDASARIPDQQALIHYADGIETLAIETRFEGTGTEFAWIVPTPSVPEVSATTTGVFPTLRYVTVPQVVASGADQFVAPLVLLTLASLACKGRRRPLVFALFMALFVLGSLPLLLPSMGKPRGPGGGVEVVDRSMIGSFEVATLQAQSSAELLDWLKVNGFATAGDIEPVVQRYIAEGWSFVAMKLRRDETGAATLTPHPMVFRFKADKPVYPLRLTAVGSSEVEVSLYVLSDQMATADGFVREYCGRMDAIDAGIRRAWNHVLPSKLDHPEITRLSSGAMILTKLVGTLSSSDMSEDAIVRFETPRSYRRWFYSSDAAMGIAATACAAGMLVCAIILVTKANRAGDPSSGIGRIVLWAIATGCVAGVITWLVIPKTTEVLTRQQARVIYDVLGWWNETMNEWRRLPLKPLQGESRIDRARRFLREDWTSYNEKYGRGSADLELARFGPREEDSPGNYTLRELDEGVEVTVYWVNGSLQRFVIAVEHPQPR